MGVTLAALAVLEPSEALADGVEGPALVAWLPTYNQDIPEVAVHGSGCHNRPERMPSGRESACGKHLLMPPERASVPTMS